RGDFDAMAVGIGLDDGPDRWRRATSRLGGLVEMTAHDIQIVGQRGKRNRSVNGAWHGSDPVAPSLTDLPASRRRRRAPIRRGDKAPLKYPHRGHVAAARICMAVDHYENFPVASLLLPLRLLGPVLS